MLEITINVRPSTYFNMLRRFKTALCQLRVGHTRKTHGFLMEGDPQPYCDEYFGPLTVRHFLVECPNLGDLRSRYLSYSLENGNFNISKILGCKVACVSDEVFKYIEDIGILNET